MPHLDPERDGLHRMHPLCAVCDACILHPVTFRCVYGGPFSGYKEADPNEHFNVKGEYPE